MMSYVSVHHGLWCHLWAPRLRGHSTWDWCANGRKHSPPHKSNTLEPKTDGKTWTKYGYQIWTANQTKYSWFVSECLGSWRRAIAAREQNARHPSQRSKAQVVDTLARWRCTQSQLFKQFLLPDFPHVVLFSVALFQLQQTLAVLRCRALLQLKNCPAGRAEAEPPGLLTSAQCWVAEKCLNSAMLQRSNQRLVASDWCPGTSENVAKDGVQHLFWNDIRKHLLDASGFFWDTDVQPACSTKHCAACIFNE